MVKRTFEQMTAAQITSAVTVTVCLLIDSIVIGRLIGVDAMSAYGLASPVVILFNSLGTMAACGVQVLIGSALGRGDLRECRVCFSTSVAASLLMAAIWILVIFTAAAPICMMLGAGRPGEGNQLFAMTSDYLRGYIIGAPFFFLSQIMVPYLQSMGKQRLMFASVAVMTVTDIALDLMAVYVFRNGMFGIGLASGISYLAATLAGIGFFIRKDCPFRPERGCVKPAAAAAIAHGGSPVIINQVCFMIRVYLINQMLLRVSGAGAVAALSVMSTVGNILFSIGLGAGSISLMLASVFYSEEDRSSIYDLIRVMTAFSLKLIIPVTLLASLASPLLVRLFLGSDSYIAGITVPGLRLYTLSLIACVLTTVYKNYYQGTGRMRLTNLISFFDNLGLLIPVTWLFSVLLGLPGVWIGILAAQFGTLLLISAIVWAKNGGVVISEEAYSLLEKDFGALPSELFEMSVTDMNSAIDASESINEFCRDRKLGNRLSMLISLCVEEIVANIISHGFTMDSLPHSADVRLVIDEARCIIRVRDDCFRFDPVDYLELHQSDDPERHIGIRMVMGMVSEVNYINSLGLNNLYMSINR